MIFIKLCTQSIFKINTTNAVQYVKCLRIRRKLCYVRTNSLPALLVYWPKYRECVHLANGCFCLYWGVLHLSSKSVLFVSELCDYNQNIYFFLKHIAFWTYSMLKSVQIYLIIDFWTRQINRTPPNAAVKPPTVSQSSAQMRCDLAIIIMGPKELKMCGYRKIHIVNFTFRHIRPVWLTGNQWCAAVLNSDLTESEKYFYKRT